MSGKCYGYLAGQADGKTILERVAALRAAGVEERNIITETAEKTGQPRARFSKLLSRLVSGDTLVVETVDALGRDRNEILSSWRALDRAQVGLVVLDMPFLNGEDAEPAQRSARSGLALQIFAYFAQNLQDSRAASQRKGIAAAKENGTAFGRPRAPLPDDFFPVVRLWREGKINSDEAANRVHLSRSTFYRYVRKFGLAALPVDSVSEC